MCFLSYPSFFKIGGKAVIDQETCVFKTHSWLMTEPESPHGYLRKNSNSL